MITHKVPNFIKKINNYKKVKIALIGDFKSGKSCFLYYFKSNRFNEKYDKTVICNQENVVESSNNCLDCIYAFFDFSGEDEFYFARSGLYNMMDFIIIFINLSSNSRDIAVSIKKWEQEIIEISSKKIIIIGTFADIKNCKDIENNKYKYFEISNKNGFNINIIKDYMHSNM